VLVAGLLAGLLGVLLALPAGAIEFFDGRLQVHGFYELQTRGLWEDLNPKNSLDLAQMYHVLDVEIEGDIAPDGWGPFMSISSFVRLEARFDCVWTRACALFPSANTYGNRPSRLPERAQNGRRTGYHGSQFTGNLDPYLYDSLASADKAHQGGGILGPRRGVQWWNTMTGFGLSTAGVGPDGVRGSFENPGDDTTFRLFAPLLGKNGKRCLFGSRKIRVGGNPGFTTRDMPWNPRCRIRPIGNLRSYPNPWNPNDINTPVLGPSFAAGLIPSAGGTGGLPYRPAPQLQANTPGDKSQAQGLFYPNVKLAERIRKNDFSNNDQNFSVQELQWNHGAAQQQTRELKEAYLDMELLDGRLWIRAGRQTIVWGKTELFRNQDRFNPQDLALSSLPSLEESRLPLWAVRSQFSFYEVGPLQDVRAELAVNFDKFQPADLGRCGEAFTALPVCDLTFGLLSHGINGIGLEGQMKPPPAWRSLKGIEIGGRLEWRYDRFSFSITDFWGTNDFPFPHQDFRFMRNVDPVSGHPREANNLVDSCPTGTEAACLTPAEALTKHSVNQQIYAWICAATVGLALTSTGGADCPLFGLFNSQAIPPGAFLSLAATFSSVVSGEPRAAFFFEGFGCGAAAGTPNGAGCAVQVANVENATGIFRGTVTPGGGTPLVPLSRDPGDAGGLGLSAVLSVQQQALLGYGPFYQTNCDVEGIDFLNAEASALDQSFTTTTGTDANPSWSTLDTTRAQPGTTGFAASAGTICSRYVGGQIFILPGCRNQFVDFTPGNLLDQYNINIDGSVSNAPDGKPIAQPFTGQPFISELAAVSWNLEMLLTAFGAIDPADPSRRDNLPVGSPVAPDTLDVTRPFALGRCSFAQPQFCATVAGFQDQVAFKRPTVRAGGNGRYGRADFVWHSGQSLVLQYARTNVLGASMDFAEDTTKSNWSVEFTWENEVPTIDHFSQDGIRNVDLYNLTISGDRPTFINFLNQGRTFFINGQLFIQYIGGYRRGIPMNGPFNFLGVLTFTTGYFQDRLLPAATVVWDLQSHSGAFLPQVSYRFTENFSATFGAAVFTGGFKQTEGGVSDFVNSRLTGRHASKTFVQNGLSAIRERDELFLRVRYTF